MLGPNDTFCCMVGGGSFGSLTSQALIVAYPAEFHGAFGNVFGSGPHRVLADQFNFDYVAQKPGFYHVGGAYHPGDTLAWGTAFRFIDQSPGSKGWSYFDLSPFVRKRQGQLHRPIVLYEPDEDTIGHGTDFLPLITGIRGHVPRRTSTSQPYIAYTSVDTRCHDAGFFTTPVNGIANAFDPIDAMMELAPLAWDSWNANPSPVQPPILADDGSEDAYAWALDRVWDADPTESSDPLVLDVNFGNGGRTAGQGMSLGLDESLRVASVGGVQSIFVGSADGVVTRFVLDTNASSANYLELVVAAQSQPLGYGAFALAIGEFVGSHSGPEVAVGTKQHLFVLDAATLSVLPGRVLELPYEYTRPRRMQIGNVFDHFEYDGEEVAFTSLLGHLVVMAGDNFGTMTDLGEPGIADFAILDGQSYSGFSETMSAVPITLLSQRGHLANITLNDVSDPTSRNPHPAKLHCWTEGQEGGPADLEYVTSPTGLPVVVAAFWTPGRYGHPSLPDVMSVRVFDANTLMPASLGQHGMPPQLGRAQFTTPIAGAPVLDIAPVHAAGGSGPLAGFVVLTGPQIAWFPIGPGAATGQLHGYILDGFPPAARALAVTTADLMSRVGGEQFREEIILTTLSGHVVWFHLEDMIAYTIPIAGSAYLTLPGTNRPQQPGTTNLPYTNRTLCGAWGMLAHDEGNGTKLFAGDQAGALWELELVAGVTTFRGDVRDGTPSPTGVTELNVVAPVRDLVFLGNVAVPPGPNPSDPDRRRFDTIPPSSKWWLETAPWQDIYNDILAPGWLRRVPVGDPIEPTLPVLDGFVPLLGSGDLQNFGLNETNATRQLQWWGGELGTYTNLIQGLYGDASSVIESWYSTKGFTVTAPPQPSWYGRSTGDCKDLRNVIPATTSPATHQMQSLRLAVDDTGPIIVASTPGGRIVILEGGRIGTGDYGKILWNFQDGTPDDGNGAMALAVRSNSTGDVDIFVGIVTTHLDPVPFQTGNPGKLTGGIRWLRWNRPPDTEAGLNTVGGFRHLDPTDSSGADPRGGFGVCGLAVGDLLPSNPGDELIATTLEGDLFIFAAPQSGGDLSTATPLFRTWVPGALGVCNSIVIQDDGSGGPPELYVGGSQGIWKWRVP